LDFTSVPEHYVFDEKLILRAYTCITTDSEIYPPDGRRFFSTTVSPLISNDDILRPLHMHSPCLRK